LHCGLKGGWKWARNPEAWTSIIIASSKDSPANGTSAPRALQRKLLPHPHHEFRPGNP
jgi:hypothetical protein